MNPKKITQFKEILINNNQSVSELEYTKNNYDKFGNLINEELPTITTDYCEIGLYNDEIYLVFILESKIFNLELFNKIKNKLNVKIYGFVDFNKTLYPIINFDYNEFIKIINKDKYVQIRFDFKDIFINDLFIEYTKIVKLFNESEVMVVNQLEVDLTKK